jgi:phosphate-selective porin
MSDEYIQSLAGVNWYPTRHVRIDGNYILAAVLARPGNDGIARIVQGRLRIAY